MRAVSFSINGSSVYCPVLRCAIRVASSCKRRVDQAVERIAEEPALAVRVVAARHGLHASALQRHGVEASRDGQVVAQHDRVAALLGGPPPDPLAPDPVAAERLPQREVVVGQVVLGEEVDLERDPRDLAQVAVGRLPGLLDVVAPVFVGDVLVREPLGRLGEVSFETLLQDGLELREHVRRRYGVVMGSLLVEHGSSSRLSCAVVGGDPLIATEGWSRSSPDTFRRFPLAYGTAQGITVKASIEVWVPRATGRARPRTTMRSSCMPSGSPPIVRAAAAGAAA